jgi:ABC-type polysaccharide/polyol phosphate transport system ATPase subunit
MSEAIRVEDVSKRYQLGGSAGQYVTFREVLTARIGRALGKSVEREQLWALRGISFTLDEGMSLGIVGHNGAGKTTLLKILARITRPTSGASWVRGRVGSLLDVGTGFHPELNGRENVYLSGSILGMKRREIDQRFDEIVDFSGLERFLDTPVKRYSWGMWLRLAFAVAAHVDPDVMLVDEVLAVGDVRFRERCLGKMSDLGREGRTVVFVSHDLGSIVRLCRRALWFENGQVRADGPSADIVETYLRSSIGTAARSTFAADSKRAAQLLAVEITDENGNPHDAPRRDEPLTISVRFIVREPIPGLAVAMSLSNHAGIQLLDEVWEDDERGVLAADRLPQEYEASLTIPPVLPAGEYVTRCWIGSTYETVVDERHALGFRLWPRPEERTAVLAGDRLVQPPVEWRMRQIGPDEATGERA